MKTTADALGPEAKAVYLRLEEFCSELVAEGHDTDAVLLALSVLGASSLLATHGATGAINQMAFWVDALKLTDTLPSSLRH